MTETEKILQQLANKEKGSIDAFRSTAKKASNLATGSTKGMLISSALMLGAGLVLKNGRIMRNAASNMRNYIDGYYKAGIGKVGQIGLLAREGFKGTSKGFRKLADVNIAPFNSDYHFIETNGNK